MLGVRAYKITPQFVDQVVKYVRAGGYLAAASEAAGVPAPVVEEWLRRAGRSGRTSLYRQLYDGVRTAAAQARLTAEIEVFKKKQVDWLLHGPGKDSPSTPGWSQPTRPIERVADPENATDSPELHRFFCGVAKKMEAHPEARAILIECLFEMNLRSKGLRKLRLVIPPAPDSDPTPA